MIKTLRIRITDLDLLLLHWLFAIPADAFAFANGTTETISSNLRSIIIPFELSVINHVICETSHNLLLW